ncbi:hypothetical protein BCR39DRAFT_564269 [Naematelia encephala]|uniref:Membrane-associating domain-domain-containing protein n=1 Tax=Naematelia encephala TaxID=71784 RepID=A0A1Y2BBN1_9TREE|nr:hypothetical protein BCR39DRAFT_564269 [Naematelia encephala]
MAKGRAAAPKSLFKSSRQIFYFSFFILWICIDVALLGLVSQQLHKYGNTYTNYPTGEYYHALGLLLFATIFALIIGLFHWVLNLGMFLVIFIANGVFFGTGAGIIEGTPFGHGLQCPNPVSAFPTAWQPFVSQCSRVTAIEGLAWAMFALSVIGLFYAFTDKFSIKSQRNILYDVEVPIEPATKEVA